MRRFLGAAIAMVVLAIPLLGQAKPAKRSAGKKVLDLVDTTATGAAAGLVDSLLGTGGPAGVSCPVGMMAVPAAPGVVGIPATVAPTAGSKLVQSMKTQLGSKKKPAAEPGTAGSGYVCVAPGQSAAGLDQSQAAAMAQMQAAQMQAAGGKVPTSAAGVASGLVGATPAGMVAGAAVAAAPVAVKMASKLGGLIGGKGGKEGMIKNLAEGRLVMKHVKFLPASDALEDGYEADLEDLVQALGSMSGQWLLNIPAESVAGEPDTVTAKRRVEKLSAQLRMAGMNPERLAVIGSYPPRLDPKRKLPKPGEAEIEVLRLPKDFKP